MNDTGNVVHTVLETVEVVIFRFSIRNSLLLRGLDSTGSTICLDGKTNVVASFHKVSMFSLDIYST